VERTSPALVRLLRAEGPAAIAVVRATVGLIFLSEGVQKFLFPAALGAGRFAKIGIPMPAVMAPFVGVVEILGGAALALGLLSRVVTIPLLIDMLVAITSTKLVTLGKNGFWSTAHEARTDLLMIAGLLLVLIAGPGRASLDARLGRG
jgi:putative oxidoreductase